MLLVHAIFGLVLGLVTVVAGFFLGFSAWGLVGLFVLGSNFGAILSVAVAVLRALPPPALPPEAEGERTYQRA